MSSKEEETNQQLKMAMALSRVGQNTKGKARQLFKKVIRADPQNEAAWMGFVDTLSSDAQRIKALEKCLEYNPNNQTVRNRLDEIKTMLIEQDESGSTPEGKPEIRSADLPFNYKKPSTRIRIFRGGVILLGSVTVIFVSLGLILMGGNLVNPTSTPTLELTAPAVTRQVNVLPTLQPTNADTALNAYYDQTSAVQMDLRLGPVGVCSPLEGFKLSELPDIMSDNYHPPPPGHDGRHMGVDFAFYRYGAKKDIRNVYIRSILPGIVAGVVSNLPPYGNAVIIETRVQDLPEELARVLNINKEQSLYHLYAHMENIPWVDVGQLVSLCHLLGQVGNTGTVAPHLHLETRYGPPGEVLNSIGCCGTDIPEEVHKEYSYWVTSGVFKHFDPMIIFNALKDYSQ